MLDGFFVVDTHSHTFRPVQTVWGPLGQSYEVHIARMDRNGIDVSVTMGQYKVTPDEQWEQTLYTVEAIHKFPDRFIGFMFNTPLWGQRGLDDMKRAADLGIRGLKLYSHGHGNYTIDSELVDPLVRLANELGWIVMIHTDIDSKSCSPHLVVRLAKRHPDVKFQMAHMGLNPDTVHWMSDYICDQPNIYMDTSASPNIPESVFKKPMTMIPDRLLFGSDSPTLHEEVEFKKLEVAEEYYGLTKEEKRKILGENAAQLYHIDMSKYLHS